MPLESLGQKDGKLNIKGIEILSPKSKKESEFIFDLEKQITPESFRNIVESAKAGTSNKFRQLTSRLLTLFPDRRAELGMTDDEILGRIAPIRTQAVGSINEEESRVAVSLGLNRVLLPHVKDESFGISPKVSQSLRRWFEQNKFSMSVAESYPLQFALQIFPDLKDVFSKDRYDFLNTVLSIRRENGLVEDLDSIHYLCVAANMRLLYPECYQGIDSLDTLVLDRAISYARLCGAVGSRDENMVYNSLEIFLNLRTLSADKVTMTPHGFEFGDKELEFKVEIPPLPELKK